MKTWKAIVQAILAFFIILSISHACASQEKGTGGYNNAPAGMELKTQRLDASFFDKRDDTAVTWLGMAGALVNSRGTIIFIDPLITVIMSDGKPMCESGYRFRIELPVEACEAPRADAVMYTHADNDHFGKATAKTLAERTECRFIAPPPVAKELLKLGIDSSRIGKACGELRRKSADSVPLRHV